MGKNDARSAVQGSFFGLGQITPDLALIGLYDFARTICNAAESGRYPLFEAFMQEVEGDQWFARTRALLEASGQALDEAKRNASLEGCAFPD